MGYGVEDWKAPEPMDPALGLLGDARVELPIGAPEADAGLAEDHAPAEPQLAQAGALPLEA